MGPLLNQIINELDEIEVSNNLEQDIKNENGEKLKKFLTEKVSNDENDDKKVEKYLK